MPPESGCIYGRLTSDMPLGYFQGGGYLACKKKRAPRNLQKAYAYGTMVVQGGVLFLMGEVPPSPLRPTAFERIWHIQDSPGQILALA